MDPLGEDCDAADWDTKGSLTADKGKLAMISFWHEGN